MSDAEHSHSEDDHSDSGLDPILTGFGVLAVVAGLTLTAVLMAGRPKYDKTDLRTVRDLKANQVASLQAKPAWGDKEKGVVTLPVARAAEVVLQEIQRDPNTATREGAPVVGASGAGSSELGAAGLGSGGAPGAAPAMAPVVGAAGAAAAPAEQPEKPKGKKGAHHGAHQGAPKKAAGAAPGSPAAAPH
jgi:hypothetical protein